MAAGHRLHALIVESAVGGYLLIAMPGSERRTPALLMTGRHQPETGR
jgi:hypothetical protein